MKDVKDDDDTDEVEMVGVKLGTVWTYFLHASLLGSFLLFLVFVAYVSFDIGSSVWLIQWSKDVVEKPEEESHPSMRGVYALLQVGLCISLITAFGFVSKLTARFAVHFHKSMLRSVMHAPMSFFDTTSVNSIVERFQNDMSVVDDYMLDTLIAIFVLLAGIFGSIIVIPVIHRYFIIVIPVVRILYFFLIRCYMRCRRRFQALHDQTHRQVCQSCIDSLAAGMTIRAHRRQDDFAHLHDEVVDSHCRVTFALDQLDRWFEIRLQFLANIIVVTTALLSLVHKSSLSLGQVGLTMLYAINVSDKLVNMLPIVVLLIQETMASLHRIREYSHITPEDSSEKEENPFCPTDWLDKGHVIFQDYTVKRERGEGFLVQDINTEILPGEKVAIVGGKGSGKDILAYGLFRTVEPEKGKIFIDGIDITTIGFQKLRSKIAFIPKKPVLLEGSIRFNLDPLKEYSDSDLWKALERAHLRNYVGSLEGGLDFLISKKEEGPSDGQLSFAQAFLKDSNIRVWNITEDPSFSDGQKQQLSLARALLKDSKILVWNEDPSLKDTEEHKLVRKIVMTELPCCTVITVSHRLYTAENYNRILVMEDGKIVEEGTPDALVNNEQSSFYKLCKAMSLV